jgi:hypothetical protein
MTFWKWRRIHLAASYSLALIALDHSGLTFHYFAPVNA